MNISYMYQASPINSLIMLTFSSSASVSPKPVGSVGVFTTTSLESSWPHGSGKVVVLIVHEVSTR